MADLRARQGADRSKWKWGNLHHIQFEHELTSFLSEDLAQALATERFPVDGTLDTLAIAYYLPVNFRVVAGASYRQIIDVADWDKSLAINVPGQSADPNSRWYDNLLEPWSKGEYFPLAYTRQAVEAIRAESHTILPKSPQ